MPSMARTRSSQYLDVWTGVPGILCAAHSITYRVFDVSTDSRKLTPLQVYPAAVGSTYSDATVDLTADKLEFGHYKAAGWSAFLATYGGTGRHRIVWSYTYLVGDVIPISSWFTPDALRDLDTATVMGPVTVEEDFDVLAGSVPLFGYCLPSDLRDEGLTTTDATDLRLVTSLRLASRMIEQMTGRTFEPKRKLVLVDGRGAHNLLLNEAIIWLEEIGLSSMFMGEPLQVNMQDVRVYNRHLLSGLVSPDDRQNPRIELLRLGTWTTQNPPITAFVRWPTGVQNIMITGVWGYTDPDPLGVSAVGVHADLVRHAAELIVMREFPKLTDFDNREDRQHRNRIASESAQGMSRSYQARVLADGFGDPEIDNILLYLRRPPAMGAG